MVPQLVAGSSASAFWSAGTRRWRGRRRGRAEAAQDRALAEATAFRHPHRRGRGTHPPGLAPGRDRTPAQKPAAKIGKRLDFLIQELHREANTLGAKSAALELTRISVDMKVLIEQMREQVQNIESNSAPMEWTTPATFSSWRPPAGPASPAWSRRCWSWIRTSRCRCRTPRARRAARSSTAASTGSSTSRVPTPWWRGEILRMGPGARQPLRHLAQGHRGAAGARGEDVVLEIDWQGALQIKRLFPQRRADLHPAAQLGRNCAAPGAPRRGRSPR
jgi:hypothetical protein